MTSHTNAMPTPQAEAQRLESCYPVLGALSASAHARLLHSAQWMRVPAGAMLFDDRQACEGFPFVVEGTVRVSKCAPSGRELPLYRVGPGETCIISSSCLLGHEDYNARGVTESDTLLMLLPKAVFDEMMAERPFRDFVFHLFAERIADLMQLIEEVAFRKLDQRLAAWLAAHAPEARCSHQAIADDLGSVREIVSRLLKQFEEQGWLQLGRERVEVLAPAALERLARGE